MLLLNLSNFILLQKNKMKIRKISVVFIVLCVITFAFSWALNAKLNWNPVKSRIEENSKQYMILSTEVRELEKEKKDLLGKVAVINGKIENKKSIQAALHELNNKLRNASL